MGVSQGGWVIVVAKEEQQLWEEYRMCLTMDLLTLFVTHLLILGVMAWPFQDLILKLQASSPNPPTPA